MDATPYEHIQLAQTHRFCGSGRSNLGTAQRVDAEEAVATWTREAARVLQWEGLGTLEPGNWADLIVVDRNPLACATESIAATQVMRTMVAGRTVFDTGAL